MISSSEKPFFFFKDEYFVFKDEYFVFKDEYFVFKVEASISQGGILGVAGKFPPAYMGAVFAGQVCDPLTLPLNTPCHALFNFQAVGGIFASGTNVVVLAMGASATDAAFFCFVIRCSSEIS